MSAATTAPAVETQLDGIACHCAGDEHGHTPGSDGCAEAPVKARQPRPFSAGSTSSSTGARGTCPGCKARLTVRLVHVFGELPLDKGTRPLWIAHEPVILAHTVKGRPEQCPGGVPTETTFRPGTEIAAWTAQHGERSILRSTRRTGPA